MSLHQRPPFPLNDLTLSIKAPEPTQSTQQSNSSSKLPKTIYVDIQALFDTRLAALTVLLPDEIVELTASGKYFTREMDRFEFKRGSLSAEAIARMRNAGRYDLLTNSLMTAMPLFLMEIVARYMEMALSTPYVQSVDILINMHPYLLSEIHQDTIRRCLQEQYSLSVPINFVNKPMMELTPSYFREECLALILYDYVDWTNLHHKEIISRPIKNLAVYVPKLLIRTPTQQELDTFYNHGTSPFEFARSLFEHLFPFQYKEISYYSANLPTNPSSIWAKKEQYEAAIKKTAKKTS